MKSVREIWIEKNRDHTNSYMREYYKKNKKKHIKVVRRWQQKNPDKIKKYEDLSDAQKEKRKVAYAKYRGNNKERVAEWGRQWKYKKKAERLDSVIVVYGAIERKKGYRYKVDNGGNIVETKVDNEM